MNCSDTMCDPDLRLDGGAAMTAPATVSTRTKTAAWYAGILFVAETLRRLQERSRDRRYLANLDDTILKDVGLTRADLDRELSRPFWHVRRDHRSM